MLRTRNTLQLIVVGLALALPMLAAPAAQAQSVKGSGFVAIFNSGLSFEVNLYTRQDGTLRGSFRFTSGGTVKQTYSVETLTVTGNLAIVSARGKKDNTLHTFFFVDDWDGSGLDLFAWDGFLHPDGGLFWFGINGDVTVTP